MGSFTSASQHYSDYRDMPMVVHPDYIDEFKEPLWSNDADPQGALTALEVAAQDYTQMIENGVPVYEARQILPGAAAVNLIWTVNARSLINFFEQRLCKRNVDEMIIFAQRVKAQVKEWWPDLANLTGARCATSGKCNQGFMSCGEPYKEIKI